MNQKKKKVKSISQLKKQADAVFSKWVRARDGKCFTCDSRQNLQCGHYISRAINYLRYDETNCNAQCVGCNVFKNGNMPEYAIRLQRKYGENILYILHLNKQILYQFKREELEKIISKYAL